MAVSNSSNGSVLVMEQEHFPESSVAMMHSPPDKGNIKCRLRKKPSGGPANVDGYNHDRSVNSKKQMGYE